MKFYIFIFLTFSMVSSYAMDSLLYYVRYTSAATQELYKAAASNRRGSSMNIAAVLAAKARINARDKDYETPLHIAANNGVLENVRGLLVHGAQIDPQNNSRETPLHLAAKYKHTQVALHLIEQGADVYIKNKQGKTVVDIAPHLIRNATGLTLKEEDDLKSKKIDRKREALRKHLIRYRLANDEPLPTDIVNLILQSVMSDPTYWFNQDKVKKFLASQKK